MAVYAMITQTLDSERVNPGTQFIVQGLMYLIKQADPDAVFFPVCQDAYITYEWFKVHEVADVLIFAGGPRMNNHPTSRQYCDWDIWSHIETAREDSGLPFMDLYMGASHYFPLPKEANSRCLAQDMASIPKNAAILENYRKAALVIARDDVASAMIERNYAEVPVLPCASWWARQHWSLPRSAKKEWNAIVIRNLPGNEWIMARLEEMAGLMSNKRPVRMIAHSEADREWVEKSVSRTLGKDIEVISDSKELLEFYQKAGRVLSLRLHGTIVALSMGAQVHHLAVNSGAYALHPFGVKWTSYDALKKSSFDLEAGWSRPGRDFEAKVLVSRFIEFFQGAMSGKI